LAVYIFDVAKICNMRNNAKNLKIVSKCNSVDVERSENSTCRRIGSTHNSWVLDQLVVEVTRTINNNIDVVRRTDELGLAKTINIYAGLLALLGGWGCKLQPPPERTKSE